VINEGDLDMNLLNCRCPSIWLLCVHMFTEKVFMKLVNFSLFHFLTKDKQL
jgi:hypothetical protein